MKTHGITFDDGPVIRVPTGTLLSEAAGRAAAAAAP